MRMRWTLALGLTTFVSIAGCPDPTTTPATSDPTTDPVTTPTSDPATDLAQQVTPVGNLEGPRLGTNRPRQQDIEDGLHSLAELRALGLKIFSVPFNKADGYGDGPMDPLDPTSPGGRPTLQDNGVFLRVNGLDAQSCLECHSVVSNATLPSTFGVGGVGGSSANVIAQPFFIDVADRDDAGFAAIDGRFINPPFVFGAGGVELLGKEMTAELLAKDELARINDGNWVRLIVKGVDFGTIRYQNGIRDTSQVVGVEPDLVVRPFGRKGQFATVREFDKEAMLFHFGIQPIEVVGADVDADGDGVMNELLIGEMSALHVFNTTLERPFQMELNRPATRGKMLFETIGCSTCHVPSMTTDQDTLPLSYPEVHDDPFANIFYEIDLTAAAPGFDPTPQGGVTVPMYSDLKRHNMGPDLAESTGQAIDPFFITARLWGIADSAPYLHDGRAMTLTEAIEMHGGDAQKAGEAFMALKVSERADLLEFLYTLRTPLDPAAGVEAAP